MVIDNGRAKLLEGNKKYSQLEKKIQLENFSF
jgi:hypothetical protein